MTVSFKNFFSPLGNYSRRVFDTLGVYFRSTHGTIYSDYKVDFREIFATGRCAICVLDDALGETPKFFQEFSKVSSIFILQSSVIAEAR